MASNWLHLLANSPPRSALLDMHSTPVLSSDVLVEEIIKHAQDTRRATIQQLAYATDTGGREAWAVATKANRKRLWQNLLFCGRYGSHSSWAVTTERLYRIVQDLQPEGFCRAVPCSTVPPYPLYTVWQNSMQTRESRGISQLSTVRRAVPHRTHTLSLL